MKITENMKVQDVLKANERMLDAFVWLSPAFERLRTPALRRVMARRVTVAQAARIASVPLSEALYLLNLFAGADEETLVAELQLMPRAAFLCEDENPPRKPSELLGLADDDERVCFLDVTPHADRHLDPLPDIMRSVARLREPSEVLLVRHPFDPLPLRDLLARSRGLASWAEERRPGDWYIYFFRPAAGAGAVAAAHPPLTVRSFVRAVAMGA